MMEEREGKRGMQRRFFACGRADQLQRAVSLGGGCYV